MKLLSKRRKAAAIVTIILAVALAVTGTMAAFIFDDEATNEWGDIVTPGGNGHDDFEGGENKDVYFENYGSATLYVRIRLDEYMEFGRGTEAKSLVKNAKRADKTTWTPHVPAAKTTPQICAPGNLQTAGVDFHDYWTWKMGGAEGERYYLPTDPTSPNAGKVQQSPHYTIADKATNPLLQPIPEATVITMAKWVEDGMKVGNFWVVDTDGWAYWAAPLEKKQTTGLLLNEVKLTNNPGQSYYYAINVRFFATDKDDIGSMRSTATNAGNALIDKLLGVQSLDDQLDDAIQRANEALDDAAANPGKYTQESIDDLTDARDAAQDVKDKGAAATDTEKSDAIKDINDNLPLDAAVNNTLDTKTPGNPTLGFVPEIDTANFLNSHDTQVSVDLGVLLESRRWCAIALDSILTNAADASAVTVAAVDPALASYIKIATDPLGNKRSVTCEWYPLLASDLTGLSSATTAVGADNFNGNPIITTDITLTNPNTGKTATVTVSFYFSHSNLSFD